MLGSKCSQYCNYGSIISYCIITYVRNVQTYIENRFTRRAVRTDQRRKSRGLPVLYHVNVNAKCLLIFRLLVPENSNYFPLKIIVCSPPPLPILRPVTSFVDNELASEHHFDLVREVRRKTLVSQKDH